MAIEMTCLIFPNTAMECYEAVCEDETDAGRRGREGRRSGGYLFYEKFVDFAVHVGPDCGLDAGEGGDVADDCGEEGAEKTKYRGVEGEGEGVVGDEEDAESEREERGDGERRVGFGM
ncbi:hypothetical protein BcDW1_9576 [Botrytis cinerea BcDW1]|uniref:Uncharacterized protein n=1 Tax=Botryotinia fuckeliana (strain BcDW1) TaxID=1290391 RepID=M7TEE5_BOTF1|nr:hypothetical protein BcDW1_9576 [Botrytis cinerea BcDW1]